MGHSHGTDDTRVPQAVRRAVLYALAPLLLLTLVGLVALWPSGKGCPPSDDLGFGQLGAEDESAIPGEPAFAVQHLGPG